MKYKTLNLHQHGQRHINKNYKVKLKLCILGEIPIINIDITKKKLEKLNIKEKIKEIDAKILKDKNNFDKKLMENIKALKINLKEADIKIELGTENAALTALIVPFISTILSTVFSRSIKKAKNFSKNIKKTKNQKYVVNPIYINENLVNISISGIFEIKMIHIINIIYIYRKKEGEDKNERTSNRRSYDYSYE